MPRALLTTDEPSFSRGLVEGYRSLGWEVAVGANNFHLGAAQYDVVHHLWPEELCGWRAPTVPEIDRIESRLEWWKARASTVFTVNNLYPHHLERDPACHRLYSAFFQHSHLITHFSEASRRLVLEEYPAAQVARHVVHHPANFEVTLAGQTSRGSRRDEMGIAPDDFVVLVFGALRSWDEVRLVEEAFDMAKVPKKRLLMAGKLQTRGSPWKQRWKRLTWQAWLRRLGAAVDTRFVPEEEVSRFWDSCDVALVPRLSSLNSGIVFAAMTFGTPVIAPRHGAYPDQLRGTGNWLYETGNAADLASRLEAAATADLRSIGEQNAGIAATWTWKQMVQTCVEMTAKNLHPLTGIGRSQD